MHTFILSKSLKAFLVRVAALAGVLTLVVLAFSASVFAGQSPEADSTPDGVYVVARVDGEPVTAEAVDAVWRREEPGVWLQNMPHLYQARLGALRIAVAEVVLGQDAADEGLDLESYIIREIDRAASPPTEAEIDQAVRALVRTQPTIPEEFRRDLAFLQLGQQRRAIARADVLGLAYDEAVASGLVDIFYDAPRVGAELDPGLGSPGWGSDAGEERVTVQVFSDFTCPFCARLAPRLDRLVEELRGDVRVVFRYYPGSNRQGSMGAAEAASCAHQQGSFDPYHDALFADQSLVSSGAWNDVARRVGLDEAAFTDCLASEAPFAQVQQDVALGVELGVRSTPTSFINGRPLMGAVEYSIFRDVVQQEIDRLDQ